MESHQALPHHDPGFLPRLDESFHAERFSALRVHIGPGWSPASIVVAKRAYGETTVSRRQTSPNASTSTAAASS